MRTPASVLDTGVLDSSSEMRRFGPDSDAGESQPQPLLRVETGRSAEEAERPVPQSVSPSMAGVPLLAVTTPLLALPPPQNGGSARVHLQFATPLLARALGRDPGTFVCAWLCVCVCACVFMAVCLCVCVCVCRPVC
jgi:hypothetical protein